MSDTPLPIDALIIGGGMAGLFAMHALRQAGHSVCLAERSALGDGQSVCAQGIVHGGVKYSLGGLVSGSAKAIERMPERWLAMADSGAGFDLRGAPPIARSMWLWRSEGVAGAFAMAGARLSLRARPEAVPPGERPLPLRDVRGDVLRMPEPVFDPVATLGALLAPVAPWTVRGKAHASQDGTVRVEGAGRTFALRPRCVVLAAGAGNASLRGELGLGQGLMQLRPLHQAMVRGPLPEFNGHCVDGLATRVTVTSASLAGGDRVWHIGGKLAEEGVSRDARAQRAHALAEMRAVLPSVEFSSCMWSTYSVNRAEREQPKGGRPEDACVERSSVGETSVLTVWPTKMALAPVAADMVLESAGRARHGSSSSAVASALEGWERPAVARAPWHAAREWVPTGEVGS
jgi:glycine/D-amino acid oxidase-like deaminating enzyme